MAKFTLSKDKVKHNPLMLQHRKFKGKQKCSQARSIRRKLRRLGIKVSEMGHEGPRHD